MQSLLSILKHRTVEKLASRCDLSIIEGTPDDRAEEEQEEEDSLESRLVIKLHCKHGMCGATACDKRFPNSSCLQQSSKLIVW